jgi:hypothetical protein
MICAGALAAEQGAMKKTNRKQLRIDRETVRNLSVPALKHVVGGISVLACGTLRLGCNGGGSGGVTCDSQDTQCNSGVVGCATANCTGYCPTTQCP